MYVYMYVCMYIYKFISYIYVCIHVYMDTCMHLCKHACKPVCMVCMHLPVHVYTMCTEPLLGMQPVGMQPGVDPSTMETQAYDGEFMAEGLADLHGSSSSEMARQATMSGHAAPTLTVVDDGETEARAFMWAPTFVVEDAATPGLAVPAEPVQIAEPMAVDEAAVSEEPLQMAEPMATDVAAAVSEEPVQMAEPMATDGAAVSEEPMQVAEPMAADEAAAVAEEPMQMAETMAANEAPEVAASKPLEKPHVHGPFSVLDFKVPVHVTYRKTMFCSTVYLAMCPAAGPTEETAAVPHGH